MAHWQLSGNRRRQLQDVGDGIAVFHAQRHEQPRHHREVERHVAFVAAAEIGDRVLRPLVGFGQQHAIAIFLVDMLAQLAQRLVRLRQVLAVRAFALEQVRHGVQPQAVDAQIEPEVHGREHGLADLGIVPVQVRLVRVEAMPVVGLGDRVPGPVRALEILEDDARVADTSPACRSRRRSCASACPARPGASAETRHAGRRCDSAPAR